MPPPRSSVVPTNEHALSDVPGKSELRFCTMGVSAWTQAADQKGLDGDFPDVRLDQVRQREHGGKAEPGKDSKNDK